MQRVETFRERLTALMKERGETVSSLARATKLPKSTISEWCAGRKPMLDEAVVRLARHLGVSVERLVTGEEPEETIVDDLLGQLDDGFVTLHSGVYRLKVEKFAGRKRRNGK